MRSAPRAPAGVLAFLFLVIFPGCADSTKDPSSQNAVAVSRLAEGASLNEILRHPDIFERMERLSQFFQRVGPDELDGIIYEFRIAPLDRGDAEYALFATWWARFDPLSAFDFADNEIRMEQPRVVTEVLRTWASRDPEDLMKAGGFRDATSKMVAFRPEMVDAVVVGWFESGKPGMKEFILSQTDELSLQMGLHAWARVRILANGDKETLVWIDGLDYHADLKRELLIGALTVIAHQNPQLCVAELEDAKAEGIDVGGFVPRIANAWAHHDGPAALEWVLGYEHESLARFRAVSRIANKWRKRDPYGMLEWLEREGDSLDPEMITLLRYSSVQALVSFEGYRPDWQRLMAAVSEIPDENRRDRTSLFVIQHWYVADEAAATAWLEENGSKLNEVVVERAPLLNDKEREKVIRTLGL